MTDVTVTAVPATPRETYRAVRPVCSFNDIPDRTDRLAAMRQFVDDSYARVTTGPAWEQFAEGLARFPQMSPANVLLVLGQHPSATRLNTHHGWQLLERTPLERGISVFIPTIRHKRVNGRTVWDGGRPVMEEVRHRPATVFDYTSTAGAHVPAPWEVRQDQPLDGFLDDLRAAAAAIGYSVESRRDAAPGYRRVFALIHGQDEREKVVGLAGQLGAAAGGSAGAELFAYALCASNGMQVPVPALPAAPHEAIASAHAGLRRVLQRTSFRNQH